MRCSTDGYIIRPIRISAGRADPADRANMARQPFDLAPNGCGKVVTLDRHARKSSRPGANYQRDDRALLNERRPFGSAAANLTTDFGTRCRSSALTGAIVSLRRYRTLVGDGVSDSLWSRATLPIGSDGVVRMRPLPAFRGASRTQMYMSLSAGACPPLTAESGHCRRGFCSWTALGRSGPTSICSSPAFGFHLVLDAPRDTPVGRLQAYAVPAG